MQVNVNGELTELAAVQLAAALIELGYADAIVATALNGTFVPEEERKETRLQTNDAIEILAPMSGG